MKKKRFAAPESRGLGRIWTSQPGQEWHDVHREPVWIRSSRQKREQAGAKGEVGPERHPFTHSLVYTKTGRRSILSRNISVLLQPGQTHLISLSSGTELKRTLNKIPTLYTVLLQLWNISLPPSKPVQPKQFVLNSLGFLFFNYLSLQKMTEAFKNNFWLIYFKKSTLYINIIKTVTLNNHKCLYKIINIMEVKTYI